MDGRKEFERLMQSQTAIALATVVDGNPNVRIVNFYYDSEAKILYFSTFYDNEKVEELVKNPQISFTTIPVSGEEHVRVRHGITRKSSISAEEIKGGFLAKMPEYIMSISEVLPALILFETTFDCADVVLDFEHIETVTIL